MNRKAALVGCREGSWVHTDRMQALRLNARVDPHAMIEVAQKIDDHITTSIFVGPGLHKLVPSTWAKVTIVDGPHESALCLLEGAA